MTATAKKVKTTAAVFELPQRLGILQYVECLSLTPPKAYCAQDGVVKETKLELEFKQYEVYEDKTREMYRPKGLLAYTTAAKEYVKIL
jgi:hypothetical protein